MSYSYRDRRNKKRTFRALWITRINGVTTSRIKKTLERLFKGFLVILF